MSQNLPRPQSRSRALTCVLRSSIALGLATTIAFAQEEEAPALERTLTVEPAELSLEVGDTAQLVGTVTNPDGSLAEVEVFFFSRSRRSVGVDRSGLVTALQPGEFEISARTPRGEGERLSASVAVSISYPPLERIDIVGLPGTLYTGTAAQLSAKVIDASGAWREDLAVTLESSHPEFATLDAFGQVQGLLPGQARLIAEAEGRRSEALLAVAGNPISEVHLTAPTTHARTGDVLRFRAVGVDAAGVERPGVPVRLSFHARTDDQLGPAASGQIEQDGRFVAEAPGLYTIVASSGQRSSSTTVRIDTRDVGLEIRELGRGNVHDTHTSDLWVWEGVDGRDYAVTGTWMGNGDAHFWDVTDPENMERVSTVTVDARTVNDVKVSADGRLCVLSREGASDRKNGIVIVDVTNPREPEILCEYTEELTGGVHNVFIDGHYVYALSAGRRYDIIDISDPRAPRTVSSFELDTPGHSIHDVWVADGIAYSSNWGDGVVMVDVGGGGMGGSPENPVQMGSYAYPSGWNHAAFPYTSEETGRTYVIAGDEAFPFGLNLKDTPTYARGWIHFIDFTDPENPVEVARYEVPEAGTHNLWVEGDRLYVAYYNGGVRVVDISGELMGALYRQGREIASFLTDDPEGYVPNAPMVWGPQPHKGFLFFSDWNSGLWSARVIEEEAP